ncbi:radical SAM protein [bacterium]|nr:radical SAM protein [bacterium]
MKAAKLLLRMTQGIFLPTHPSYLVFFVTSRCNCSCSMCFNRRNVESFEKPADLTLREISLFAGSIHPLPQLLLSGGEPFIREDVAELVHLFYRNSGTRQISIPTNGALTRNVVSSVEKMLELCPEAYFNINLSIDGIGADHDRSRNLQGCFESILKTYAGLARLRENNNRLSINVITIIKSDNAGKEMEIVDFIKREFDVNYHFVSLVRGDVDISETDFEMDVIDEKLDELYAEQGGVNSVPVFSRFAPAMSRLIRKTMKDARNNPKRNFHCRAGRKIVVLTADGDLYPCEPLWLEPDVRRSSDMTKYRLARMKDFGFNVRKALKSPEAKAVNRYIDQGICSCRYACAMLNSIIYCPRMYPRFIKELIN